MPTETEEKLLSLEKDYEVCGYIAEVSTDTLDMPSDYQSTTIDPAETAPVWYRAVYKVDDKTQCVNDNFLHDIIQWCINNGYTIIRLNTNEKGM